MHDEVCALRALVADPTVLTGPALEPPSLPAPVLANTDAWAEDQNMETVAAGSQDCW